MAYRLENNTEFYARFAYFSSGAISSRFQVQDVNSNVVLDVRWSYAPNTPSVSIYLQGQAQPAATVSSVFLAGWSVFEIYFLYHNSSGSFELKRNGLSILTFNGQTKLPAGAATLGFLVYRLFGSRLDDLAVNDTNPTPDSTDMSWCGDGHVAMIRPEGNGDQSQFVGSDGNSTNNYALVNEGAYGDVSTYVESDISGNRDLYQAQNISLRPNDTIKRVWMWSHARELAAESDTMLLGFKSGSTEEWGSGITLETDWRGYVGGEYRTSPFTSTTWTQTEINAMQIGVKVP